MPRQALPVLHLVLLCVIWMTGAFASASAQPLPGQPSNISAELLAEADPAPGGRTTLAIRFTPKPGWHGYWINPGDAGRPSEFKFDLPPGVSAGEPAYPVPSRLTIAGLMNHIYKGEHVLLVPLTLEAGVKAGTTLPIRVSGEWLACTDKICVPESGQMQAVLRAGDGKADQQQRARFDGWRQKLPLEVAEPGRFTVEGRTVRIAIPLAQGVDLPEPWLFARTPDSMAYGGPQSISRNGDWLVIEAPASPYAQPFEAFNGLLATGDGRGFQFRAVKGDVPVAPAGGTARTAMLAFGGALLGGLLLNILPCVFPIISLKALGLARSGESEAQARAEALAYTAGVVLTCLALGGLLLGLRAAGLAVGWAFQLQNPWTIGLLLILCLAITANLAGWFTLRGFGGGGKLAGQGGKQGAFWTGALAAFVATPCTGPFMAAALGAALVLPVPAALAIFAGLGLGMALPFLAIGYVPALRARLPRPGPWMERFRKAMAVPMAVTALALGWLLLQQVQGRDPIAREQALRAEGHVPFSEAQLAEFNKAGRPVFLYFTADWCLTCKVNEAGAISAESVRDHFRKSGIAVMVGDWTNGDPAITRFLEAQGRTGVPLYLFYPTGAATPRILPQILTPAMLTAL